MAGDGRRGCCWRWGRGKIRKLAKDKDKEEDVPGLLMLLSILAMLNTPLILNSLMK
jgi:hypothetical protein